MAYIMNIDEYESAGTYWIVLYVIPGNVTYLDGFGVEYIPKETKKFLGNKNMITNIDRKQAYDLIMYGYFCIGIIDFMLKGKRLLDYADLFSAIVDEENDKIIPRHFQ